MRRDDIDFHAVPPAHCDIHDRLINWARWARGGRGGHNASPMFRLCRAADTWIPPAPSVPIDSLDGQKLEKAVAQLPERHSGALRWQYVYSSWGVSLYKACRGLGVPPAGLLELVHGGRAMLMNRGACARH